MGYLNCYCQKRIEEYGFGIVKEVFADSKKKLCEEWLSSYESANGFMTSIIFLINVINLVIAYIISALVKYEKSHNTNQALTSATLKIFIAQFINSVDIQCYFRLLLFC
jgi:hypothetical protein